MVPPAIALTGSSPRGENNGPAAYPPAGSSPRGRGKRLRTEPQGAGARAHPRAGGENTHHSKLYVPSSGSSPRGRGKPIVTLAAFTVARLIPARAGKTSAADDATSADSAHPRMGGENHLKMRMVGWYVGSSPRGRGKRVSIPERRLFRRLIPARAGKTWTRLARWCMRRAHPRAGGENCAEESCRSPAPGSSPRGRGKHLASAHGAVVGGLIPARAGKTAKAVKRPGTHQAHPRAGGENYAPFLSRASWSGSSPRGRGKRWLRNFLKEERRLIPARAGKTSV